MTDLTRAQALAAFNSVGWTRLAETSVDMPDFMARARSQFCDYLDAAGREPTDTLAEQQKCRSHQQ